ncbi:Ribonuclease H protein [Rutstroemia sp. NJR-2017a BVV2]|nr:Ribonuclease H protein [Rutstroemia sp. NJR-2017a BVV2]
MELFVPDTISKPSEPRRRQAQAAAVAGQVALDPPTSSAPTIPPLDLLGSEDHPIDIDIPLSPADDIAEETPAANHPRRRWAWVWKHMPDEDLQTIYLDKKGKVLWRCNYCKTKYLESGGTRIIASHLRAMHHISDISPREERKGCVQATIEQAMANVRQSAGFKRRRILGDEAALDLLPDAYVIEPHMLEVLFVRLFARCSLSFHLIECDEFRAMLSYINKQTDIWLPSCSKTVSKWIHRTYDEHSKIYLIIDCWTSPNNTAMLGIVAQFVDENSILKTFTLVLKEVNRRYIGENLAGVVLKEIEKYGFATKLGSLVMDNGTNNDTLARFLSTGLYDEFDVQWDPIENRLRCFAHSINLFLFTNKTINDLPDDPFDEEMNLETLFAGIDTIDKPEFLRWKKEGAIGKCHMFQVRICRSPRLQQLFVRLAGRRIARDNSMRWNSMDTMIGLFLDPQIRHGYNKFWSLYPNKLPQFLKLSDDDWNTLTKIHDMLVVLRDTTEFTEGNEATLERVLPTMEYLLEYFEDGKETYPHWIPRWKKVVEEYWKDHYKAVASVATDEVEATATSINVYIAHLQAKKANRHAMDEYATYLASPPVGRIKDVQAWWRESMQQDLFPNLSEMALDLLSIPSTSASCERLFSSAGITLSDRCNRLAPAIVEVLECLKSWMGIGQWIDDDMPEWELM